VRGQPADRVDKRESEDMRALVIGGDGKLGSKLCTRLLERGHVVHKTTRRDDPDAPVRKNESILKLNMLEPKLPPMGFGFNVVYIMAAITGVVPAERHPDAWRVNAEAPLLLAAEAFRRGDHVVFPSSGTVELAPHTASARQKSYVESHVLAGGGCVVRPLPYIRPEWYNEVADLFVAVGEDRRSGVVRWGEDK